MYRGVQRTSTPTVAPNGNVSDGENATGGVAHQVSYEITNFTSPNDNRKVLVNAIIKNDEKEIRNVMSSKFSDDIKPQPVLLSRAKKRVLGSLILSKTKLNRIGRLKIL